MLPAVGVIFEARPRGAGAREAWDKFRREPDDRDALERGSCLYLQVTHLSCPMDSTLRPYTFAAEKEWFNQRTVRQLAARIEQEVLPLGGAA